MSILEIIQLLEGSAIARFYLGIMLGLATVSAAVHFFVKLNQIKYEAREIDGRLEYIVEELNKIFEFQKRSVVIMSKAVDNTNENVIILGKEMDILDDKMIDIKCLLDKLVQMQQPVDKRYEYTTCAFPFTKELEALHCGTSDERNVCEECDDPGKAFVVTVSSTDPSDYEVGIFCKEHYRHNKEDNDNEKNHWSEFDSTTDWRTHAIYMAADFPQFDKIMEELYKTEKFDLSNDEIVSL